MKLKSYFAGTVEAAVDQARQELGPEAMLVDSHKAPPEARHLGEYEVVFTLSSAETAPREVPPVNGVLHREIVELRRQMEEMRKTVWRAGMTSGERVSPLSKTAEVLGMLADAEVDPQLAQEIAACVEARLAGDPLLGMRTIGENPPLDMEPAVAAELNRRFSVDSELGRPGASPRTVALVGPPGAGKTTTLVKLAVTYGLARRQSVQLLSMDSYRVAATDQLRTYAAILGAGFQELETSRALEQALEENCRKGLILIDTPGYGSGDIDNGAELAAFLSSHPAIDAHLVLPASMKSADLSHAVDRFEIFRPAKLLFTKADETGSFGPLFSEAVRTGKPISFLATGQQIPEDLEAAAKDRITGCILRGWSTRVLAAA